MIPRSSTVLRRAVAQFFIENGFYLRLDKKYYVDLLEAPRIFHGQRVLMVRPLVKHRKKGGE